MPLAEPLDERLLEPRRREFRAAALAEDAADQRRGRDHVALRPGLRQLAERGVLGRQQRRVGPGGADVGVDPRDVGGEEPLELLPAGAVELAGVIHLLLELGRGVGRELPLRVVHRPVRG